MIGTYFPEYASKPETEDEKKVASAPQPKKTGVYEYLVFVVTGEYFGFFLLPLNFDAWSIDRARAAVASQLRLSSQLDPRLPR